jgi:hypothetical protein
VQVPRGGLLYAAVLPRYMVAATGAGPRRQTVQDVARDMEVLSSVKTYMRRIYKKLEVNGKEEMLLKLSKEVDPGKVWARGPEVSRTE